MINSRPPHQASQYKPKHTGGVQNKQTHPKREKIFCELESPFVVQQNESVIIETSQESSNELTLDPHESTICTHIAQTIKHLDLTKFKIEQCKNLANGKQHNHKHCRYYHTLKDIRRPMDYSVVFSTSTDSLIYTPDLCDFYESDKCKSKEKCKMSHNRVESVYHPQKYKTKYCTKYPKNLNKCEYGDYCSFAHSSKELKVRLIH